MCYLVCGTEVITEIEEPIYSWDYMSRYDTGCSTTYVLDCGSDLGAMYTECANSGEYKYSGDIVCEYTVYNCSSGYTKLNDSYCYKYN